MARRRRNEFGAGRGEGDVDEEDVIPEIILLRRKNMARNAAMMAALNMAQSKPSKPPTLVKRLRPSPSQDEEGASMPLRRSGRLKGITATEGDGQLYALPGTWVTTLAHGSRHEKEVLPIQEHYGPKLSEAEAAERKKILEEEINARDDGTTQSTASYQHCLHRVRTMSDMALARRVKAIERARGKSAKEKMLVFSHVLRGRGKNELCALAEAALDRLVRGLPMPESDGTPFHSAAGAQASTAQDSAADMSSPIRQRMSSL